ncbi:MAG: hypothetical protein V1774_12280 [Candidatus Eisenbacteria bacterium]
MKTVLHTWLPVALLFLFLAGMLPTAEAAPNCRTSKGGSSTDALGEEYPEFSCWPILFGLDLGFLSPLIFFVDDGLGEEFPEKRADSKTPDALGEEFPE